MSRDGFRIFFCLLSTYWKADSLNARGATASLFEEVLINIIVIVNYYFIEILLEKILSYKILKGYKGNKEFDEGKLFVFVLVEE